MFLVDKMQLDGLMGSFKLMREQRNRGREKRTKYELVAQLLTR